MVGNYTFEVGVVCMRLSWKELCQNLSRSLAHISNEPQLAAFSPPLVFQQKWGRE